MFPRPFFPHTVERGYLIISPREHKYQRRSWAVNVRALDDFIRSGGKGVGFLTSGKAGFEATEVAALRAGEPGRPDTSEKKTMGPWHLFTFDEQDQLVVVPMGAESEMLRIAERRL